MQYLHMKFNPISSRGSTSIKEFAWRFCVTKGDFSCMVSSSSSANFEDLNRRFRGVSRSMKTVEAVGVACEVFADDFCGTSSVGRGIFEASFDVRVNKTLNSGKDFVVPVVERSFVL